MKDPCRRLARLWLAVAASAAVLHPAFATCDVTALFNNNSTSQSARAPSIRYRYARSVYLITAQELAENNLRSGEALSGIGWSYSFRPGDTGTGNLTVYLQNTSDVTNVKSNDWTTAISGMTVVHNAMTALPDVFGPFMIPFSGGSPFTYTGAGLYVGFDWQYPSGALSTSTIIDCNNLLTNGLLGGQSQVGPVSTIAASSFRPETHLQAAVPAQDVSVTYVVSLGAVPVELIDDPAQVVHATVYNLGDTPVSVPVTMSITGAETFTDTRTSILLAACDGFDDVIFAPFTPAAGGTDTITVSVPADDVPENNALARPLEVSANKYSYMHAGIASDVGLGYNGASGGEIVARFTTAVTTQVDSVDLDFFQPSGTDYRVVVRGNVGGDSPGALLYVDQSARTVTAPGPVSVRLPSPVPVGPGAFFVGIKQANTTNASFGFNYEVPLRYGLFWYAANPATGPWNDFQVAGFYLQPNVGVVLGACLAPMTVDVAAPNVSACAGGSIAMQASTSGGTGPYTYQWTENGIDVPGATAITFIATKASEGSFTYNCRVTDSGGCQNVQGSVPVTATWSPEGASCDDANGCTAGETCSAGACGGGTPVLVPDEVTGLAFQADKQTLVWNSAGGAGPGTVHDVPRGLVSQLPVGSGAGEVCLATVSDATTTDGTMPPIGDALWYLVRGRNSCGTGTYGFTSNSVSRITSACP